jgi:hypothetical protein
MFEGVRIEHIKKKEGLCSGVLAGGQKQRFGWSENVGIALGGLIVWKMRYDW